MSTRATRKTAPRYFSSLVYLQVRQYYGTVNTMKEHFDVTTARSELELATVEGDLKKITAAHQRLLEALARSQKGKKQKTAKAGSE